MPSLLPKTSHESKGLKKFQTFLLDLTPKVKMSLKPQTNTKTQEMERYMDLHYKQRSSKPSKTKFQQSNDLLTSRIYPQSPKLEEMS